LTAPACVIANAQDLPLEVRLDIALLQLERAIIADDHKAILKQIEAIRELDPVAADGELLLYEASAAAALGDFDRAEGTLSQFLSIAERGSDSYSQGLELLVDLPKRRAEHQEARQRAELAQRERERRERDEAARKAEDERLAQRRREEEERARRNRAPSGPRMTTCTSTGDTANIRTAPTTRGSSVLAALKNGTEVIVLDETRNPAASHPWYLISYATPNVRMQGYIYGELLTYDCQVRHNPAVAGSTGSVFHRTSP